MQATVDLALELNCEFANFYSAMAYPGSKLYELAVQCGWSLPAHWSGYSQHAPDTLPLPTRHLSAREVLRFRDEAFQTYFGRPEYLRMIGGKFGDAVVAEVARMTSYTLHRSRSRTRPERTTASAARWRHLRRTGIRSRRRAGDRSDPSARLRNRLAHPPAVAPGLAPHRHGQGTLAGEDVGGMAGHRSKLGVHGCRLAAAAGGRDERGFHMRFPWAEVTHPDAIKAPMLLPVRELRARHLCARAAHEVSLGSFSASDQRALVAGGRDDRHPPGHGCTRAFYSCTVPRSWYFSDDVALTRGNGCCEPGIAGWTRRASQPSMS